MLTKTSSAKSDPQKATAYGLLVTNLIVLPGIGSIIGEKKAEGIAQMCLALAGTALSVYGSVWLVMEFCSKGIQNVFENSGLWILLIGVAAFLIGWLWSGWTGIQLIREAKQKGNF